MNHRSRRDTAACSRYHRYDWCLFPAISECPPRPQLVADVDEDQDVGAAAGEDGPPLRMRLRGDDTPPDAA